MLLGCFKDAVASLRHTGIPDLKGAVNGLGRLLETCVVLQALAKSGLSNPLVQNMNRS